MSTPPIEWYRNPELDTLTPLTVTKEGRVWGHLAAWDSPHRSFPGRAITAPRSQTDYREFMTGQTEVVDAGQSRTISTGNLTVGGGHADTSLSADATRRHYDAATSIFATVTAGEDACGIWLAGAMLGDVDEFTRKRALASSLSGDWRRVGSSLELCAALAVPVPGFSVPRSRVASGAPLSLVAAGALAPARSLASFSRRTDPAWQTQPLAVSDELVAAVEARLDARKAAGELSAAHAALVSELDDTPAVVAALLAEVDDTPHAVAALLAELDEGPRAA